MRPVDVTLARVALVCGAALVLAGCASIRVTDRQEYEGAKLPRPDRILVYDFATVPEDLPAWSDAAKEHAGSSAAPESEDATETETEEEGAAPAKPSEEELELGRKLGVQVAGELAREIQEMGLTASRAEGHPMARPGDLVIVGYFTSVEEGSAAKRIALGFGSGAAELTTEVEGYQMTEYGMRKLGSGTATSAPGKSPGVVVPLAVTLVTKNPVGLIVGGAVKAGGEVTGSTTVEGVAKDVAEKIAEELRVKFGEQGWIET